MVSDCRPRIGGYGARDTMQESKLNYLSTIDVFRDLTLDDLMRMDRQVTMAACNSGKIFFMPDERGEVLFLLKKGRVQLYRLSPNGKKLIVATLGPGAIFGEMSLVGQGMYRTFAEAVDECMVCVMSRADVAYLIREKPQVAFRFVEALGERLTETERRLEDFAFKSVPARLAGLLLTLAAEQRGLVVTGFTHQELAEMLGTYRETVTQALSDFKAQGLVQIRRKQIVLVDKVALRRLAEE